MSGRGGSGHRETYREGIERRAAIDDPEIVLNVAARFLQTRPRSIAEVRRYLAGKGYNIELAEAAVGRLLALGMLDDEAFARAWLESRDRARPRGEPVLRRELAQKGIDREVVATLLDERRERETEADVPYGEGADLRAAERLVERRRAALMRVSDPRLRAQRAYALLARNGFGPDVCRAACARLRVEADDVPEA
jgi:regulatory protein